MKFCRLRNWEKYQHYKSPRPAWVKFFTKINDSMNDWRALTDVQLGQVARMMAYAAHHENTMPAHPELLQELLGCDNPIQIEVFVSLGVMEVLGSKEECLSREKSRVLSREKSSDPSTEYREESTEKRVQKEESDAEPPDADPPVKEYDPESHRMCRVLANLMRQNDPKARLPKTDQQKDRWLDAMDKIHRLDGRSWSEIEAAIRFSQGDDFWKSNILSAGKLREQMPKLLLRTRSAVSEVTAAAAGEAVIERMRNGELR